MNAVQEIQSAVAKLTLEELSEFRGWFWEFDAKVWDRKIEEDVVAGRLDKLAEQAMRDFEEGRCIEL